MRKFFRNAKIINSSFTVEELDIVAEVYCRFTRGQSLFKKLDKKVVKCNVISGIFGDKSNIEVRKRVENKVKSLKSMAKQHIMQGQYPKDVLVAAVCKVHHIQEGYKWEAKVQLT